jgi:hypothetical protein
MKEIMWSVCTGDNCLALQGFVRSLRSLGVNTEFVAWSEFNISGAESIPFDYAVENDPQGMWKFDYFKKTRELYPDALLAYFSPQHYVSSKIEKNFNELMKDEDALCFLESNIIGEDSTRDEWGGVQGFRLYDASRSFGNLNSSFYNVNANHFFVKPHFGVEFMNLIKSASSHLSARGYKPTDELCLAMVVNLIRKNEESCKLSENQDFYGIDSMGVFSDKLPEGRMWESSDWMTGKKHMINPSIALINRNSSTLRNLGRVSLGQRISKDSRPQAAKSCGSCQRAKQVKQ